MRAGAIALPLLLLAGACTGGQQAAAETADAVSMASQAAVETLDAAALAALVEAGKVSLVDVRSPEEFASGHLAGAVNMPVDSFDPAAVPHVEGRETILYCRSGRRSGIAAERLAAATGGTVRHLDGGILAWEAAGEPVETAR